MIMLFRILPNTVLSCHSTDAPMFQEQCVVDFENLSMYSDIFRGLDTGFCCVSTTKLDPDQVRPKLDPDQVRLKLDPDQVRPKQEPE